jgi:dipeptidase E
MNLVLTSDFPSTSNELVFDRMRSRSTQPRIAWIPPFTDIGRKRFTSVQEQFESRGFGRLEYCDIDEEVDETQLAHLEKYVIVYLSGGDPVRFRSNILRTGLSGRLRHFLDAGGLVIGASGGSMQLTQNVSLFRLQGATLDEVFTDRQEYEAAGVVEYEILPHFNRFEPQFLETVRQYSERVGHDIVALADGAAVLHTSHDAYYCGGEAARFRKGVVTPIKDRPILDRW